jgi:hypothetical protein
MSKKYLIEVQVSSVYEVVVEGTDVYDADEKVMHMSVEQIREKGKVVYEVPEIPELGKEIE